MIDLLTAQPLTKAAIAEKAGWYTASGRPDTRRVELEVQRARLEGQPIVSDSDGYRLSSDPQEVAACARRLRSRLVSQAITARALRKTARRLAERAELTLFGKGDRGMSEFRTKAGRALHVSHAAYVPPDNAWRIEAWRKDILATEAEAVTRYKESLIAEGKTIMRVATVQTDAQARADAEATIQRLRDRLQRIANVAHLAWTDPPSVREAFEAIERQALADTAPEVER